MAVSIVFLSLNRFENVTMKKKNIKKKNLRNVLERIYWKTQKKKTPYFNVIDKNTCSINNEPINIGTYLCIYGDPEHQQ